MYVPLIDESPQFSLGVERDRQGGRFWGRGWGGSLQPNTKNRAFLVV